MCLFSFLRFAKRYGVVDSQLQSEMAGVGERPRRRNELTGNIIYIVYVYILYSYVCM